MSDELREKIIQILADKIDGLSICDYADEILALFAERDERVQQAIIEKCVETVWMKYRHVLPQGRELTSGEKIHNSAIDEAIKAIRSVAHS